ncbi:MAG: hypothetical protein ABI863_12935 [Ginsengibacter sp.]
MKACKQFICVFLLASVLSCNNDKSFLLTDNYSSVNDFLNKNGIALRTYTIDAANGGSFTTAQGTIVTIPSGAFVTQSNLPVTGNVTIQFKDIYKKSDMLLADMPAMTSFQYPLKSGGEFFIKAISNGSAVVLAPGKKIDVTQPASLTGGLDTINKQAPFVKVQDSTGNGWYPSSDAVSYFSDTYVFDLYQFHSPVDSGTWCNSDNASYFFNYNLTNLTLKPNDSASLYGTQVFLVFSKINCLVHVYNDYYSSDFRYMYAPGGLQCTLVALGVRNKVLYSSFVPITITANESVSFSLSKTTTDQFKSQLAALN